MIPQTMPLGRAARRLGVSGKTLKRWLEVECGLVFETLRRGESPLIRVSDLDVLLKRRLPGVKFGVLRKAG